MLSNEEISIKLKNLKNRKIIYIHKVFALIYKNSILTFLLFAIIATGLSIVGFVKEPESKGFEFWMILQGFIQAFQGLSAKDNGWLILGKFVWMMTFASAALSLFLREWSFDQLFKSIKDNSHTAIVGIGILSHNYIRQLDKNDTLIFNTNSEIKSDSFKENGFAIKDINLTELEKNLNISEMSTSLINTGDDRTNINIAFGIINTYIENDYNHQLKLIVRIENRELNALFLSNSVLTSIEYKDSKIELKTYSFFEECAAKLFQDNYIDGVDNKIIHSKSEYSIIIAGDGKLANKIVYEASKMAHLPNENLLNIYLITQDPAELKKSIIKNHPNIELIPTIKIHEKELDYKSIDFFTDDIWHIENLTNAIICYDDENINLEITASLQNKTYLRTEEIQTKILFGVFNQGSIAQTIDNDTNNYANFIPFGNAKDILIKENILDDKNNLLAKLINYTYDGLTVGGKYQKDNLFNYKVNKKLVDNAWFKSSFTDKLSSLAQAKHIIMKLKVLGFDIIESDETKTELLQINRKLIDNSFDLLYEGNYNFPTNFKDKFFDKMIRMEHNRWNAYHYLNGWEYSETKNKDQKEHDCLFLLEDFPKVFVDEKRLKDLIEWDIYAFMYIPNYLAEAGYQMIKKTRK